MEMEYSLTSNGAVVLHHVHVIKAQSCLHFSGDDSCQTEQSAGFIRVDFKDIGNVFLHQNQHMAFIGGKTIQNYLKFIVFIYSGGAEFPRHDFTENTVAHKYSSFRM